MKMTNQNQSQEISDETPRRAPKPDCLSVAMSEVKAAYDAGYPLTGDDLLRIERSVRARLGGAPDYCRQSKTAERDRTIKLVCKDYDRGISKRSIAEIYNISLRTVERYLTAKYSDFDA